MKVSGKRLVLSHYPKATIERCRGNRTYFLVRKLGRTEHMWTGCGDTPAQAWNDAADRLGLTALKAMP